MRKLLIILAFLPLFGFGQIGIGALNGGIWGFNGGICELNTLKRGAMLKLLASSISEDSLTYNSTSDLVIYASVDTVVLDGSAQVVIGNSVRFGSPTVGTIYQILDTLGSSDTLILDQTFTGSVTDEFYWGGIGKIYDKSGKANNAIQPTAIYQPKLLTDNSIYSDGVDDYLYVLDNDNLSFGDGLTDTPFSISVWINIEAITAAATIIGKHSEDSDTREYKLYLLHTGELVFALYDESVNVYIVKRNYFVNSHIGTWINITTTYDGSGSVAGMKVYVNNDLKTMTDLVSGPYVAMENTNVDLRIAGKATTFYYNGKMDNIYINNRVFNSIEIETLYKKSIHYTP